MPQHLYVFIINPLIYRVLFCQAITDHNSYLFIYIKMYMKYTLLKYRVSRQNYLNTGTVMKIFISYLFLHYII